MSKIDLSMLQDNGLVLMWVTNAMDRVATQWMTKEGYTKIESIVWVKISKDGRLLRRGGCSCWHNNE